MDHCKSWKYLNNELNDRLCDELRGRITYFLQMPIADALNSENYLIKILAVMDKRVGMRTLQKLAKNGDYKIYPEWVRRFYELRLSADI